MTDVRREGIPQLWSTVKERTLAEGFSLKWGYEAPCVCRRRKLSGIGAHCEKVREREAGDGSEGKRCDR